MVSLTNYKNVKKKKKDDVWDENQIKPSNSK